ncbi:hypothetical protein [Rhodococcus jostii]|uniref:hypothetical protein n=1 Tax=Rhodococcus jostii TaxID=132919 RepID=UPI003631410B
MALFVIGVVSLCLILVVVSASTAHGQSRRSGNPWTVFAAGMFFPIAWVVWYLRDRRAEKPR